MTWKGRYVSSSSPSTAARATSGPSTSARATARLRATTGVGVRARQLVVQRQHLAPVRLGGAHRIAVHGADRSLDLERARCVAPQACPYQLLALGDQLTAPPAAVLIGQQDDPPGGVDPRRLARLGQQQQGEQTRHLGLVRHQLGEQAGETDRLGAQVVAQQLVACRRRVALVVDQVGDGQHGAQPVGQLSVIGHAVGDVGVADLALGAHEALGHRRLRHQEGAGDLARLQTADQAQREGDLHVRRRARGGST